MFSFGEEFATDPAIIRLAFDRVVAPIRLPDTLYRCLFDAYDEGDAKTTQRGFESCLCCITWHWPELEKWRIVFAKTGVYPYMWHGPLIEQQPLFPETVSDMFGYFTFKELKHLILDSRDSSTKAPRSRKEAESRIVANVADETIKALARKKHETESQRQALAVERHKYELLQHTISLTTYQLRDYEIAERGKADGQRLTAVIDAIGGCPVEDKFAEQWRNGKIKRLPPFFPGDRTSVRFLSDRSLRRWNESNNSRSNH